MNKDKFLKEIKKILSDKKMSNLITVLIILAFALIAFSVFSPKLLNKNDNGASKDISQVEKEAEDNQNTNTSLNNYEEQQKKELETILKSIDGVGDVKVMITFEGGEEKVLGYDNNTQTTTTEETDTQGGKRLNNQQTDGSKVVMSSSGGDSEPFITKTNKPKVIGVMIAAKGAENSKVKYDIESSVSSLFDISVDKVHVYTMKK